ncbi:alkylmercury lyase family protein [Atopobacter phocae]|uniref:alkylmercury lyase family protein n=1 Tax=Atopobacter phocae TaxID=136492 RepID=UPI000470743D|nr:alkylmercury lyase family protein [Atopobacter phocae]
MSITPSHSLLQSLHSIESKLSPEEIQWRNQMIDALLSDELLEYAKKHPSRVSALQKKDVLQLNSNEEIMTFYPFSLQPTPHHVTILSTGQTFYAMCAIDSIGIAYMLQTAISITSQCHQTGEQVTLHVTPESITSEPNNVHALYVDLSQSDTWSTCCCCQMHFYKDPEAFRAFVAQQGAPNLPYELLDLNDSARYAQKLFERQ